MAGIRTVHEATGASEVFSVTGGSSVIYWADFATGSGSGTVQLEVKMSSGDWAPAAAAVTTSMGALAVLYSPSTNTRDYRWRCTAFTSGDIITYLE